MHVRVLAVVAAIAVAAFAIGGAGRASAPRENAWTVPHVLTISDGGEPNTLNPHLGWSAPVANLSELTMAWLVRWDKHNQPYPELATQIPSQENGGVSNDGLTITYHLRRGVVWSDGVPFTADDVVFSTNVVNNPANNEGGRLDQVARVWAPDKYTVVYRLKKPFSTSIEALFSSCCANPSLLPKHLLAQYANINDVPYNSLPVGIGPFKFERWDKHQQVVLVANPLYWRGRPKLDKIVYKIVTNRDELYALLAAHKVDMWYQFNGSYLPRIKAIPGLAVARQPSYAYDHIDFNLTRPALADATVREAMRLALDRRKLVDDFAGGIGIVQDTATPVAAPYFADVGTTQYDRDKANALLDQAGWVRGADGVRAKDGLKLDFKLVSGPMSATGIKEFASIVDQWREIGVNVAMKHVPSALLFAPPQQGGVLFGKDWDLSYFTWAADPLGDYSVEYGCTQFPPAGQNNVRWCNHKADAAMDALYAHYTQAERTADVKVVMEEFTKDVPSIVTMLREDLFAYDSDLKNYAPNNLTPFDNMMNVDI